MTKPTPRLGIVGGTGAVGQEILAILGARGFGPAQLVVCASDDSDGIFVDYGDDELPVERVELDRLATCDGVLCASPDVPEGLFEALVARGIFVVDLSGILEGDPEVPLFVPGVVLPGPRVAVVRGVVAGLALALRPIAQESPLERLTVTTLESASGAGRRGLDALQAETLQLLSAMDGGSDEAGVFPLPLAFDCLPMVGDLSSDGETQEERRARHVLRRMLGAPSLPIDITRLRVPIFTGALAVVAARLVKPLASGRARELWQGAPGMRLLDETELPTPRTALVHDEVALGRVRLADEGHTLAFVIALDSLRRGGALSAIEAADQLLAG